MSPAIAAAPISWGVCEVPGWSPPPPAERVLAEMSELGVEATELGPVGFLPPEPDALARALGRHGLRPVGRFLPVVLEPGLGAAAAAEVDAVAAELAAVGADVLVFCAVGAGDWEGDGELSGAGWTELGAALDRVGEIAAARGLAAAFHPHAGTLVESREEVEWALAASRVGWCLDTGHLEIGGFDPAAFAGAHARRVVHVHLKDVDAGLAARVRSGELSLLEATGRGLFTPLGAGDVAVGAVLAELAAAGYDGWLVIEQDAVLGADGSTAAGAPPREEVRRSLEFIRGLAT